MTTETNAERLERVMKIFRGQVYNAEGSIYFDREDANWLIQQAELAEKLAKLEDAKFRFYNNGFEEDRWALQEENARLREALEFYAGNGHYELWQERDGTPLTNEWTNDVTYDGGVTARTALNIQEDSR